MTQAVTAAQPAGQYPGPDAQRASVMIGLAANTGFFSAGHPFPWAPPGREFWTALLAARLAKKPLERVNAGPPNKGAPRDQWIHAEVVNKQTGEVSRTGPLVPPPAYMYVSAEQYIEECDRCCLPAGIVVVPSTTVGEAPAGGGGRILGASYYVAHAETGQGLVLRADVPIPAPGGMGDPVKKAYTVSWSMFVRGFLAIPGTDTGDAPPAAHEDQQPQQGPPPQQWQWQQPQQGPPPGYGQQQPPQQWQQTQGPPPGHFRGADASRQGGYGPEPQPAPQQAPGGPGYSGGGVSRGGPVGVVGQQGHWPPPQGYPQGPGPGPVNGNGRIHQEPLVQQAQAILEADDVTGPPQRRQRQGTPSQSGPQQNAGPASYPQGQPQGQRSQEQEPDYSAPPPAYVPEPIRGSRPGDPQTVEAWTAALVAKGWQEETAMSLAAHKPDEPIGPALKTEILNVAFSHFGNDRAAVHAAFDGTGFVPMPNLPEQLRPKPTGLQLLRFALNLDLNKSPAAGAATA